MRSQYHPVNGASRVTAWAGAAVGAFSVDTNTGVTPAAGETTLGTGGRAPLGGVGLRAVVVLEINVGGGGVAVGIVVGLVVGVGVAVRVGVNTAGPQCLFFACTPPCPRSHGVSGSCTWQPPPVQVFVTSVGLCVHCEGASVTQLALPPDGE